MIRVKNLRVPYDTVRPLAELAAERLKTSPCAVHGVIVVHKDQIKPAEGFTAKQAMEFAVSGGTVGVRNEKKTVKSEES